MQSGARADAGLIRSALAVPTNKPPWRQATSLAQGVQGANRWLHRCIREQRTLMSRSAKTPLPCTLSRQGCTDSVETVLSWSGRGISLRHHWMNLLHAATRASSVSAVGGLDTFSGSWWLSRVENNRCSVSYWASMLSRACTDESEVAVALI
jgi:hypothetical protein